MFQAEGSTRGARGPGRVRNPKEINSPEVQAKTSRGRGVPETPVWWRPASAAGGGVWASPPQSRPPRHQSVVLGGRMT